MLDIILGNVGSGKTFLLTLLALDNFEAGKEVYANYNLKFKYTKIRLEDVLHWAESDFNLPDSFVCLDELYLWAESRGTQSSLINKILSYFAFQSRKRFCNITITAQLLRTFDVRLREIARFETYAFGNYTWKRINKKWDKKLLSFDYTTINLEDESEFNFNVKLKKAEKIFKLYNTQELIDVKSREKASQKYILASVKNVFDYWKNNDETIKDLTANEAVSLMQLKTPAELGFLDEREYKLIYRGLNNKNIANILTS